ncbi:MAG: hypothetical protein PVF55_06690 [Desulfobacterales bacterium]
MVCKFLQTVDMGRQTGDLHFADTTGNEAKISATALQGDTNHAVTAQRDNKLLIRNGKAAFGEIAKGIEDTVVDQGEGRQITAFTQGDDQALRARPNKPAVGGADHQALSIVVELKIKGFMNVKENMEAEQKEAVGNLWFARFDKAVQKPGDQGHLFNFTEHRAYGVKFFKSIEDMMMGKVGRHQT